MKEEIFFSHIKNKKSLVACFVIGFLLGSSLFTIITPFAYASHNAATVNLVATDLTLSFPPVIEVFDPTKIGDDPVQVTVTTSSDLVGITLTLTETSFPGIFDNVNPSTGFPKLFLMNGDNKFPPGTTVAVTYDDSFFINFIFSEILTVDVNKKIYDLDSDFISPEIIETDSDTGVFEGQFTLSATGSSGNNQLGISPGDIFSVSPPCGDVVHGQITPVQDGSTFGAIKAKFGDTVTVMYGDSSHTDTAMVTILGGGCGGSGGGLVISPVVLNVLAGGTSGGDFTPPQLTIPKLNLSNLPLIGDMLNTILNADPFTTIMALDDPSIDYPISINGNGYLLTQFANTIQTYTGKTGEPVSFKMTLFDATGVEHIALYTNLRGDQREVQDSDTFITYNEDKPLEITDPHGFFSNVNFTESEYNGKYIANFNMTFAKPMETSDVIIRTWDELKNSGDIKVFDAIKIEGEPIVNPDTNNLVVPDSSEIVIPYYKLPYYEIPNADSEGNLIYYNSFGGLEHKQVHPNSNPVIYPDEVGKNERHDDGFYESIMGEETRAQTLVQSLIGNPFTLTEDKQKDVKFHYPDSVGKLDRENKEMEKDIKIKENLKAVKIFNRLYSTGHLED